MRLLLHLAVITYGLFEILCGFIKLVLGYKQYRFDIFGGYIYFNAHNSLLYIILINFLGGGIMAWYAYYTIKTTPDLIPAKLKNIISICNIVVVLLSLYELVMAIVLLSSFDSRIMQLLPIFIFCIVFFIPKALLPVILVYVNNVSPPRNKKRSY